MSPTHFPGRHSGLWAMVGLKTGSDGQQKGSFGKVKANGWRRESYGWPKKGRAGIIFQQNGLQKGLLKVMAG